MFGALAPLLIHELVKDRDRAWRYVRITSAATAVLSAYSWRERIKQEKDQREPKPALAEDVRILQRAAPRNGRTLRG
jgi:hypothetical protein